MKAVILSGDKWTLRDVPMPVRRAGEALISVSVAGLCTSDLDFLKSSFEFYGIPGHEFAGVVADADDHELIGRRVVAEVHCPCGVCQLCRMGLWRHCRSRTAIGMLKRDGAFAEYLTVPQQNIHVVPSDMPNDVAVFVEPVSTVNAILDRISPKASDRCAVIGDDSLSIITAQVMAGRCRTVMLGRDQENVAAAVALGIDARTLAQSDERDFDIAIEATGVGEVMLTALELLRPTGYLVLKDTIPGFTPVPLWKICVREITVVGTRCGPFPPAIEALARGAVEVAPLVTGRFALEDFGKAVEHAARPGSLKVLIYPGGIA